MHFETAKVWGSIICKTELIFCLSEFVLLVLKGLRPKQHTEWWKMKFLDGLAALKIYVYLEVTVYPFLR